MKFYYLLILTILFGNLSAQETKNIDVRSSNMDSLLKVWKDERIAAKSKIRDSITIYLNEVNPDSVFDVNISNNYFHNIHDLSSFKNLKTIFAENNLLETVEKKNFIGDSLERVFLNNNEISEIRFPKSKSITSLNLSHNNLKRIPRSVRKLKNLKSLTITNNQIKKIPRFLRKMDSLQEIDLSENKIKLKNSSAKNLSNIEVVLLASNNIKNLPKNINKMRGVKKLNLAKNELSNLPNSFVDLKELEHIIFYKNEFDQIPSLIFQLTNLKELDFYYNKIEILPNEIGELINLQQLFLSFNRIKKLPSSIEHLNALKYLYAHHNELIVLPDCISNMYSLQRLDFGNNKIFYVPDLSKLTKLIDLNLQENNIEQFPWSVLKTTKIHLFLLNGNPLILSDDEKNELNEYSRKMENLGNRFAY